MARFKTTIAREAQIMELASRPQGVNREELLKKVKSPSLDALIRRMVEEKKLIARTEKQARSVGALGEKRSHLKEVRVYKSV